MMDTKVFIDFGQVHQSYLHLYSDSMIYPYLKHRISQEAFHTRSQGQPKGADLHGFLFPPYVAGLF